MSDPKEIFLQPECCASPDTGRLWCEHDAPQDCDDGVPWTRYVLADQAQSKALSAVIEYEAARQDVNHLSKKRSGLIAACTINAGADYRARLTRPNCLVAALDEVKELNNQPYESYEYSEVLYDLHGEGKCCDNCYEAYRLKKGPLADARQRFGHAKRRLAAMGKTLMRNEQETTP